MENMEVQVKTERKEKEHIFYIEVICSIHVLFYNQLLVMNIKEDWTSNNEQIKVLHSVSLSF